MLGGGKIQVALPPKNLNFELVEVPEVLVAESVGSEEDPHLKK